MNISLQKYCQKGNIKHFITSFFIYLSQFLLSAYMGHLSKQKGVMRDAMFLLRKLVRSFPSGMTRNFKLE